MWHAVLRAKEGGLCSGGGLLCKGAQPGCSTHAVKQASTDTAPPRAPLPLQERNAAVIKAEGESESAKLISDATKAAGQGLIELRRIEVRSRQAQGDCLACC